MLTGKAGKEFSKWFVSDECLRFGIADDYVLVQAFADSKGIQIYLTPTTNRQWTFSIFDNNTSEGVTNEMRGTLEEVMTAAVKRLDGIINANWQ